MSRQPRIEVVDALRGLAVMAIMLLHNIERFNLYTFPDKATLPSWLQKLDTQVWDSLFFLFGGKAYAIFAFLFGFTFFIQFNRRAIQGHDFGYRFLWRIFLLVGFAFINATFFPGDVLLLFATVAPFLFITRHWKTKYVVILATILLLQPVELIRYFIAQADATYSLPASLVGPHIRALKTIIVDGSLWETLKANFYHGQIFSYMWAVENGRYIQTAGIFLMGMVVGRGDYFSFKANNIKFWWKTLLICTIAFIPLYLIVRYQLNDLTRIEKRTLGASITMWRNLSFTGVLISSFIIIYYKTSFQKLLLKLAPYGKMSLTNYIMQSIIGFILYFPIGLNLAPVLSVGQSVLVGIVCFILQLQFCKIWLKHYKQGPLEYVWHQITWIKKKQ
ncbi:DUF418 domain-containing protein [Puteibacter caeruleilacunae]|nr:DUF418 domain-containing protein [Puteibacter caeruleilacunae]